MYKTSYALQALGRALRLGLGLVTVALLYFGAVSFHITANYFLITALSDFPPSISWLSSFFFVNLLCFILLQVLSKTLTKLEDIYHVLLKMLLRITVLQFLHIHYVVNKWFNNVCFLPT